MRSYIITGGKDYREDYIQDFIDNNNIKSFNVIKFSEKLTISFAREIKKILSFKSGDKRLILITGAMTQVSQNALLKSLEELPEYTDVIISCETKEEILPTILSRSNVIHIGGNEKKVAHGLELQNALTDLINDDQKGSRLSAIDQLLKTNEDPVKLLENIILTLRFIMIENITTQKNIGISFYAKNYILGLKDIYPLVKNNNVNTRLALENIFAK